MSNTIKMTVSTLAATLGVEKIHATGFMHTLVNLGLATKTDEIMPNVKETAPGSGKFVKGVGKGLTIYLVNRDISLTIPDHVKSVEVPKLLKKVTTVEYVEIDPMENEDEPVAVATATEEDFAAIGIEIVPVPAEA